MSATPSQREQLPEPPGTLPTAAYCLWVQGRDDKFRGLKPVIESDGYYLSGYRAACDYLAASKLQPASSGTITISASEPANITDPRDEALSLIEIRIIATETQLASIADAVHQLSSRVSEIEQQQSAANKPPTNCPTANTIIDACVPPGTRPEALPPSLQPLFDYFYQTHGLAMTSSELHDIKAAANTATRTPGTKQHERRK